MCFHNFSQLHLGSLHFSKQKNIYGLNMISKAWMWNKVFRLLVKVKMLYQMLTGKINLLFINCPLTSMIKNLNLSWISIFSIGGIFGLKKISDFRIYSIQGQFYEYDGTFYYFYKVKEWPNRFLCTESHILVYCVVMLVSVSMGQFLSLAIFTQCYSIHKIYHHISLAGQNATTPQYYENNSTMMPQFSLCTCV